MPYGGRDPYVRPPLYGQIVAADVLGLDPVVQISEVLGLWNFTAYAVYDSGRLAKFVLVNLDEWNSTTPYPRPSQPVSLSVPEDSGIQKGIVQRLVGSGAGADEGIIWGGLSWNYTDERLVQSGCPSTETLLFDKQGKANLTVACTEAILITLETVCG